MPARGSPVLVLAPQVALDLHPCPSWEFSVPSPCPFWKLDGLGPGLFQEISGSGYCPSLPEGPPDFRPFTPSAHRRFPGELESQLASMATSFTVFASTGEAM